MNEFNSKEEILKEIRESFKNSTFKEVDENEWIESLKCLKGKELNLPGLEGHIIKDIIPLGDWKVRFECVIPPMYTWTVELPDEIIQKLNSIK